MNTKLIQRLLSVLPRNNGLYRLNPVVDPGPDWADTLLAYADSDPVFPWKYVSECHALGMELPVFVTSKAMHQAYDYLRYKRCSEDFQITMMFTKEPCRNRLWLIRGLLIAKDFPMEETAKALNVSLQTVKLFEELFFNVRDRINDAGYISGIVYPTTRQVQFTKHYNINEGPGELLLRVGFEAGGQEALHRAGFLAAITPMTSEQYSARIRTKIMSEADRMIHTGFVHQPSEVVRRASSYMVADAQNSNSKPAAFSNAVELPPTCGDSILISLAKQKKEDGYLEARTAEAVGRMQESMKEFGIADSRSN